MGERKIVLIVEDDAGMVELLQFGLGQHGYDVVHAKTSAEFFRHLHARAFDAIICDVNFGERRTGVDLFLETAKSGKHRGAFVLMTGEALDNHFSLQDLGPRQAKPLIYFKPFSIARMTADLATKAVATAHAARQESERLAVPPDAANVRHDLKNKLMVATENARIAGILLERMPLSRDPQMAAVKERVSKTLEALEATSAILYSWEQGN